MIQFADNTISFDYSCCQQCGACLAVCPVGALSMNRMKNGLADISVNQDKCIKCRKCYNVCPANKIYDYTGYFDNINSKKYYLGYNRNKTVRSQSSSGGVAKSLIIEALKTGYVDGVYALANFHAYPYAQGQFFTKDNIPTFQELTNSVYHSVMQCLELARVQRCERLMVIGTACQLRALDKALTSKFKAIIKVCIFCKQQKTLDSTRFLAKVCGTKIPDDLQFSAQYRGNGWPGVVKINSRSLPYHRAAQIPFGQRIWTVPGCNVCSDSFGFLAGADITLMDPWVIRNPNNLGETVVIVSTEAGDDLLNNIPIIALDPISFDDVMPALSIGDVRCKQVLEPFYRGDKVNSKIAWAARLELFRRGFIRLVVSTLPRMPLIFYRVLCKTPDFRKIILRRLWK